jgi:hypothetical protein
MLPLPHKIITAQSKQITIEIVGLWYQFTHMETTQEKQRASTIQILPNRVAT